MEDDSPMTKTLKGAVTAEQICGLARVVRANAQAGFENIALWHERDISHSSVERVILADSAILTDYMLAKTENLLADMRVLVSENRQVASHLKLEITEGQVMSNPEHSAYMLQALRALGSSWHGGVQMRDDTPQIMVPPGGPARPER